MAPPLDRHRPRVLVVDDDDEMRSTLRRVLESIGYAVDERQGGNQVASALSHGAVHALILDKEMPDGGGLEVLRTLRQTHPDLPVILITAFGGAEEERRAREFGAAYYLDKPFRLGELTSILSEITRRAEASCPRASLR